MLTPYPRHDYREHEEYRTWLKVVSKAHKGVHVRKRWQRSYDAFLTDMGPAPAGEGVLAVKLLSEAMGYEKGNCVWMRIITRQGRYYLRVQPVEPFDLCVHGHPLTAKNTYRWTDAKGRAKVACLYCRTQAAKACRANPPITD
jgi:hypothetical protein